MNSEQQAAFEPNIDPRYNLLNNKIPVDISIHNSTIALIEPDEANSNGAWNDKTKEKTIKFSLESSGNQRDPLASYVLKWKGHAETSTGAAVDPNSVGIPFYVLAAMISGKHLKLQGKSVEIQQGGADYELFLRALCELSYKTLESRSDIFAQPTIESTVDLAGGLSPETVARSHKYLTDAAGYKIYHQFAVPLSLIFSSLQDQAAFVEYTKMNIELMLKAQNDILFQTSANTDENLYKIDEIQIVSYQCNMSTSQDIQEMKATLNMQNGQNFFYKFYDIDIPPYKTGGSVKRSDISNAEAVILAFDGRVLLNHVNRYQFTANGLKSIYPLYGKVSPVNEPITIDPANRYCSIEPYLAYQRMIKKESSLFFDPPLKYERNFQASLNPEDDAPYFIWCCSFNSSFLPKVSEAKEILIKTTQQSALGPAIANPDCTCITAAIRWQMFLVDNAGVSKVFFT